MIPRPTALLVALSLLLAACSSAGSRPEDPFRVDSGDLVAAMRGADSFSMHPSARFVRSVPGRSEADLRSATDAAVIRALQRRGYSLAPSGQGERVIAYAIGAPGELTDAELVRVFGPGAGRNDADGGDGLALAILNGADGRVEWRGSMGAPARIASKDRRERDASIQRAVDTLFERLPVVR